MAGTRIALTVSVVWLLAASNAHAQDGYQATLEQAVAEYGAGNYDEARALFTRAHQLNPNARTLRGIGMTEFELRLYVDSTRTLRAALADRRRPLSNRQRRQVQDLVERARAFIGRYRTTVGPEGATLRVDGAVPQPDVDGWIVLDVGEHVFVVDCTGCEPTRRTVHVRGGEQVTLELLATRVAATDRSAGSLEGSPSLGPPAPAPGEETPDADAIPWLVSAGAAAVVAAVGAAWWLDRNAELERCDDAGALCFNRDTLGAERTTAAVVTIGAGVGAAVLTVIGLLGVDGEETSSASVTCLPGFLGAGCHGAF